MNKIKVNNTNRIRIYSQELQPILDDLSLVLVG